MAELTGQPMATIVNWFMILIIFVFDPLAIAMVVAANMAFVNIKGIARDPKDYEVYKQKTNLEEKIQKEINSISPLFNDMTGKEVREMMEKKSKKDFKDETRKEVIKMMNKIGYDFDERFFED